jgi:uncharacterized protein involved in exopolysaccharide biosynthesis
VDINSAFASQEETSLEDLRQKVADLKQELDMSPRAFEDKLLQKLREEILESKKQMQNQLKADLEAERQRMKTGSKQREELKQGNRQLQQEVHRLKQNMGRK